MKVLITGVSSGLGAGLARAHLAAGHAVWGVSRRAPPADLVEAGLRHEPLDLADEAEVPLALARLLEGTQGLDVLHLNAGQLGEIQDMGAASTLELRSLMDVNVWANKFLLDALDEAGVEVRQVVAISSGASVKAKRGWGGYAISKAALNMLVALYATERPQRHMISLAPGLVDTAMQDHLCGLPEDPRFGAVEVLKAARGTPGMPDGDTCGARIVALLPRLASLPSGSYADLRVLCPTPGTEGPLADPVARLPAHVREVVERATPIPSIAAAAGARAAEDPGMVRADIGQILNLDADLEVPYGPPVGLAPLREALAETYSRAHGLEGEAALGAENVCVTTGAAEGLSLLFRCFAQGQRVALPRAHWSNYRNGVALAGGEAVMVDFFDAEGALDVEGLRRQLRDHGASLLVANFPCNPTGAVLSADEAGALAAMVRDEGLLCVADEVYDRLRYDGVEALSLLPLAPDHVVSVGAASKEYLLPGARVGWVLSASATLTDRILRKVLRASSASPNVLGQRRALALIEADLEDLRAGRAPAVLTRVREAMRARRDRLLEVLERHQMPAVGRPGHRPEGTIFLMASVPGWFSGDDAAFAEAALEAGCVSTVPGHAFGMPGSVRFSYGGLDVEAIDRLDANLAALRASAR